MKTTEPVRLCFRHGLGDVVNFAHTLPVWAERGYRFEIECDPDKAPVFRAAGAATVGPGAGYPEHGWSNPGVIGRARFGESWADNKVGINLDAPDMPNIGRAADLWGRVCAARLDFRGENYFRGLSEAEERAGGVFRDLGRADDGSGPPVVLVHANANTSPERKDLSRDWLARFWRRALDGTDASFLVLDWDDRTPCPHHWRVRHLWREWGWKPDLFGLFALQDRADLFVGVDSGPLHFLRLTGTPGLGLWRHHHPAQYALPRGQTLHLVPTSWDALTIPRRVPYQIVSDGRGPHGELCPDVAADTVRDMLAPDAGLSKALRTPAAVAFFTAHVRRTQGGETAGTLVDRQRSFGRAFQLLSRQPAPTIVETGSVRSPEDWAGAGFFGVLAGMYLHARGSGKLWTVELDPKNAEFARGYCADFGERVEVVRADSREFLEKWHKGRRKIDLLYSDSADVGTPGFEECCLQEVTTATEGAYAEPAGYGAQMILIDDTFFKQGQWYGKGSLAVPYLLSRGWALEYSGYQALLRRA